MSQPARRIFRYSPSDTEGNMSVTTIGALHLYNGPELSSLQQHGVGNGRGTTFSQKPLGGLGQHTRPQPGTTFTLTRASNSNLQNLASNVVERDSEGSPPIMPRVLPSSEAPTGEQWEDLMGLPPGLLRLLDPQYNYQLLGTLQVDRRQLNNRQLDKLVVMLGRSKALWRRILALYSWLGAIGHVWDDRLCTTFIRVCSQHGQADLAIYLYEWMQKPRHSEGGGAGLRPTVFTYTAVMRAALSGNMVDKAYQVWEDAEKAGCQPDCRMCTVLIEVCTKKGDTMRALNVYQQMCQAPPNSKLSPSVHAYTAAMRAAAEGGQWQRALEIWDDMKQANCRPSGHAFAAAISACASGGNWARALKLFDEMLFEKIQPDVVSCTALVTALASDGQYERAQSVINWMTQHQVRPNVRTYTALITAMCNAQKWDMALQTLRKMKTGGFGGQVEPNAYTYSALLKTMGEKGQWQWAERVFSELERETAAALADCEATTCVRGSGTVSLLSDDSPRASSSATSLQSYSNVPRLVAEELLSGTDDDDAYYLPSHMGSSLASTPGSLHLLGNQDVTSASVAQDPLAYLWNSNGRSVLQHNVLPSATSALAASTLHPGVTMQTSFRYRPTDVTGGAVASPSFASKPSFGLGKTQYKGPLNEVVCGAMMHVYERAGKPDMVLDIMRRASRLGIQPNTIMYNTAMAALARALRWKEVQAIFLEMPVKDAISYETLVAAYGLVGDFENAERAVSLMIDAKFVPRDYTWNGLISAYSVSGDLGSALNVLTRMVNMGHKPTVHVYNSLIQACERHQNYDLALHYARCLELDGLVPNEHTKRLLQSVSAGGVTSVEQQQLTMAAISACLAAAGGMAVRAGYF